MSPGDLTKAQIHQLQAENAELQANNALLQDFKHIICREKRLDSVDSGFPYSQNPVSPTCVCKGELRPSADLVPQLSLGHGEAARSQTVKQISNGAGIDDECQILNTRPIPENVESSHIVHSQSQSRGQGRDNLGPVISSPRSDSTAYTFQSPPLCAVGTEPSHSDLNYFITSSLDPDLCFGSLTPFKNPNLDPTSSMQTLSPKASSESSHSESGPYHGMQRAITLAVGNGHVSMVHLLIRHGADINTRDTKGRYLLMLAVERKDVEMIELLLKSEADVTNVDGSGMSALDVAASLGHVDVAAILLQNVIMAR